MQVQGPLCHQNGIRGWGDPEAGVIIVGIAPGQHEAESSGRPFTGPSGRLLDSLLKVAGWSRERTYTTNLLCWWNNKPFPDEIKECWPRLDHELREYKPRLIITEGQLVHEAITGHPRRKGSRGAVVWSGTYRAYILDTHHPSFALQASSMNAVQDIIRDFGKIPDVLDWPCDGSVAQVSYSVVNSLEEGQAVLDALPRDGRPVTLDIEASNPDIEIIDPYRDRLLCFAIAYDDDKAQEHCYVFPTRILPDCIRSGDHIRKSCQCGAGLVFPTDVHWTFQAGQYDIPGVAEYFGVMLPLRDDTMLMSYCADERPGYHGLKGNAREFLGAGWWEDSVDALKRKGRLDQAEPADVEEYNAKDAIYDKRLVPVFHRKMQEEGTTSLYQDLLLPAMQTFISMQRYGVRIDQQRLNELAEVWFDDYLKMYDALRQEANDTGWPTDDINLSSIPQMRKLFYEIYGIEPTKLTKKTRKPALDKEVLDRMDHPFAAKIRAFRTLEGITENVFSLWEHLKYDGLLHPSAFVTTTRTGRTSYRNPAMQNCFPKPYTVGEDYARIQECVIPHNPDTHEIGEYDYNQIEVWLAWAFSQDDVLLSHLQSGDVHSATAEGAFKTKRELWSKADWDVKRQNAKKIRFGIQYGEGAEKLASPPPVGIGGTQRDAQVFINNYKATYPDYTRWMAAIQHEALKQGYLVTPSGRVMHFPLILDHKELRQALNFKIQGTATDYNLSSMTELFHPESESGRALRALNSWVILNKHDALVVEQDKRYRAEVVALVRSVMERPRFPGFPSIKVDAKVGPNLGQLEKV